MRACILGIIPGDIVEKAVEECGKTLAGNNKGPLKDRIAKALNAFKEQHRVTQEMIEDKFGYNADSFTEHDFVELINIFNSIKDGLSKSDDWFDKNAGKDKKSGLAASFEKEEKTTKKPSIKDLDKEEVKSDGDKPNVSTDKR
ncbi:hypothetical protein [Planococcus faecalis]|uniref:hypothetical protein n=1 Tax=Planococcus faecalis TaxID=1598147 RepID=UPI000A81C03F|nr:hypothetical protein [Planococcus faecalis]